MNNVIELDNERPHIVLQRIDGKVDCSPVQMYRNIVDGKLNIQDVEGWEILMRSIIKAWILLLEQEV